MWNRLVDLGGVILPACTIAYSLAKGYFPGRGLRVYRVERPAFFWSIMGFFAALGLFWAFR
jgi:hypothetical protein